MTDIQDTLTLITDDLNNLYNDSITPKSDDLNKLSNDSLKLSNDSLKLSNDSLKLSNDSLEKTKKPYVMTDARREALTNGRATRLKNLNIKKNIELENKENNKITTQKNKARKVLGIENIDLLMLSKEPVKKVNPKDLPINPIIPISVNPFRLKRV